MLSASQRQPRLLHVGAVDHRQTWSVDKSWRCVTLSGFLHSHIVRCRWNPISCGTHYSGPGLSENDSDTNNKAIHVNCIYAWSLCEMVNCSWPSPRRNTRQRNWTSNSVSYLQSVKLFTSRRRWVFLFIFLFFFHFSPVIEVMCNM